MRARDLTTSNLGEGAGDATDAARKMAKMVKLGLFNLMGLYDRNTSPASVVQTSIDMVTMAEDLNFDIAWFAEHHFTNHSICPAALMMVTRCIPATRRIRLGPAVLPLPFHNPLRLVQEVAFADLLSGGRLVLGLGCGYQPYEFDRFGVDPARKHEIMLEVWDILDQGLKTGAISHSSRNFHIPPTELPMRPFGLDLPEVYVVSTNQAVLARAARGGHTPFMSFGHRGLEPALQQRRRILEGWTAGGGSPETMPLAVQRFVYVTERRSDALHAAECVRNLFRADRNLTGPSFDKDGPFVRLMPFHDEPPLDDFLDNAVIGGAAECAERLAGEIAAMKPSHLSCFMGFAGIGRRETLASMERFGADVLPLLGSVLAQGNLSDAA
jgi:alkanesulfonate monooxygenase SsuD/methylene tetrahydromethanopterin reductase-like flavin-dependent oxidoreductase (luciferase family)